MHHEAEIRLVEAHAQRGRGHEGLDLILLECGLELLALRGVRAAGVGGDGVPGVRQRPRGVLRRTDGQGVDDPAARQLLQVLEQPREPDGGGGQLQHAEPQGRPGEGTAQHEDLLLVSGAHAELLADVLDHALVRGGRGGQHCHGLRQVREHVLDPAVVRAEVVSPVRDAVCLVHHEQAEPGDELRELLVSEARVVETFRGDEQDVQLPAVQCRADLGPLRGVGGGDGRGAHTRALRGGDLVPHQRQQRRDDEGWPEALGAHQQRRKEVDGGLPPPCALDHERPAVVLDERRDGLELPRVEVRRGAAREVPQVALRALAQRSGAVFRRLGHGRSLAGASDTNKRPAVPARGCPLT